MRETKLSLLLLALLLGLFASSCKKDDDNGNNDDTNQPDPEAIERARVLTEYTTYFLGSEVTSSGWDGSESTCTPGTISQDAISKVLMRINYYRRCVGLNDNITFDATKNGKCQKAALMMDANNDIDHYPPSSWSCWTQEGSDACGSSNIAMGYSPSGAITAYIRDSGSNNTPVGHRRWILYSRSLVMGVGHTTSYNALWVTGNSGNPLPANFPAFIPWPPRGYVPAPLVYPRWSFSKPLADFSNAQVTMTDPSGTSIPCSIISSTSNGYGDNTIVWEPTGINTNSTSDIAYNVTVSNVNVNSGDSTYTYKVTIIQP